MMIDPIAEIDSGVMLMPSMAKVIPSRAIRPATYAPIPMNAMCPKENCPAMPASSAQLEDMMA